MKILVAPDKFKDALAAPAVTDAIAAGIHDALPGAEIDRCPLGDGGDGSGAIIAQALGGEPRKTTVSDPLGRPIAALWWHVARTNTAIIEMAQASGLHLLRQSERNAATTTSFGTGELICAAMAAGCDKLMLCVGGSATVDGGAGCLQALGCTLLDQGGAEIARPACGASLASVERVVRPESIKRIKIEVLCDVDNPLCGPRGAAEVFAAQKGATQDQIAELSSALARWAGVLHRATGCDASRAIFSGAAGGVAAGLLAVCGARLISGFDRIAEIARLSDRLRGCALCMTGEGRLDAQTAGGKTVAGVARLARTVAVRVVALVGQIELFRGQTPDALASDIGLSGIHVITPANVPLDEALRDTRALLRRAASSCIEALGP